MRRLIINADDCNLTPGVTRGILCCHDRGGITSTTVLMNLPLDEKTVRELNRRPKLGVGIHLNVTLGKPLGPRASVSSLMKSGGRFKRPMDYFHRMPREEEVAREYDAQIRLFEKRFGRKPDHLDTHHHLHDFPVFFKALAKIARKWQLPLRRSRIFQLSGRENLRKGLKTTDYLFGNLEARFVWRKDSFFGLLESLPAGTSEIACHPAFCDAQLREISSLKEPREVELRLFSDKSLRKEAASLGIELTQFSQI